MTIVKSLAAFTVFSLLSAGLLWADQHKVTGMVLKIDVPNKTVTLSCLSIPGYMEAMVMPFEVRDKQELTGLTPGATVEFTWTEAKGSSYAENIQIQHYESVEQDPFTARRLKLLNQISHPGSSTRPLSVGQTVPDFTLIDQDRRRITLSRFSGKVVVMNFIYTSCALPNFCFRNTNNFGVLQKRFKQRMGRDLVLLTVTFDPQRDSPDKLARYAETWKADSATWHFLTGTIPDIQRVTDLFGMDYFPDEGLMDHSLHTAIIDRQRKLVTNIEGNQFTADQLADLVETILLSGKHDQHN
jgi:protein SCO1